MFFYFILFWIHTPWGCMTLGKHDKAILLFNTGMISIEPQFCHYSDFYHHNILTIPRELYDLDHKNLYLLWP